jgi:aspartyl-tRNA(Asn)/glutamyl-tRNA(Gln) amidotransferase subunit A
MLGIRADLGDTWPEREDDLTPEMRSGLRIAEERYGVEARLKIESRRTDLNEAMATIFDQVDLVLTASNPDIAFAAEGPLPDTFGGVEIGAGNNGRLTFPANLYGCPAISVPAGACAGLPVGLQVVSRHFTEPLLLDIARLVERDRPWPLVASHHG